MKYRKKLRIKIVDPDGHSKTDQMDTSASCFLLQESIAKGVDIQDVNLLILFDLPDIQNFAFLVGRTGRANKPGTVILLYHAK